MNQPDGSVHTVAEGPEEKLKQFESFLKHGQPPARVDRVEVNWSEFTGEFTRFTIRWFR